MRTYSSRKLWTSLTYHLINISHSKLNWVKINNTLVLIHHSGSMVLLIFNNHTKKAIFTSKKITNPTSKQTIRGKLSYIMKFILREMIKPLKHSFLISLIILYIQKGLIINLKFLFQVSLKTLISLKSKMI